MKIRLATIKDIPWLLGELRKFSEFIGTSRHVFGEESHVEIILTGLINDHVTLLSEKDGTPSGFIIGILGPHPFNPSIRLLSEQAWWVTPEYRGSRAGLMLLDAFLEQGRKFADWVTISTEAHSSISENHLAKRGLKLQEKSYLLEVQ